MATNLDDLMDPEPSTELERLVDIRRRIQAREPVSKEELREAVDLLRQGRASAAMSPAKKSGGGKKKGAAISDVDLSALFG